MSTTIPFGVAVVPAIVGLVEVAKQAGLSERFAPILAVILGIAAGVAQQMATQSPGQSLWIQAVTVGISLGLSAAGLYSGTKTMLPGGNGPLQSGRVQRTDENQDPPITFVRRPGTDADVPTPRPLTPTPAPSDPKASAAPFVPPPQQTPEEKP